jgi:hypothetical protein
MIWYRTTALLVALLVAGCGNGSAAQTVHTHGTLVRVGGPPPGGPMAIPGARLEIRGRGGSVRVRTDRHGRFTFDLPAGVYHVRALGHSVLDNRFLQPVPREIHVRAGAPPLHLYVDIK